MRTNEINLLKTNRFLPLFITQFLGAFNDNTFKNALAILITYRMTNMLGINSQILITLAGGIFILPFFLFSVTAGELADKYEKSRLIAIIKLIEICLMGFASIAFYLQNVFLLMCVLFALGTHSTFFGPLKYAILPDHLHEDELIAGNGLIEAGTFISILLGTIFGGVFILLPYGEYIISFIICIVAISGFISSLYIPKTHKSNVQLKISFNIFKETFQLMQYAKERKDIFLAILGISWFWLYGAVFLSEFPVFVKDTMHANENVVTLFLTLFSIGLAVGSLLCNRLLKGKVSVIYVPVAVLGMTLFTFDLYFASSKVHYTNDILISLLQFLSIANNWRISFDLLSIAICGGLFTVPLYAILQQRSDKTKRASVMASNNIVNALFMVIASLVTMLLLKLSLSVIQIFLIIAILNAMVAIYICKLLPGTLIKSILRSILKLLYRVEIKGIENYYEAGNRVIIIANHTSFIDALLLGVFLPDEFTFAVNTFTAKKWWVRLFTNLVDAYPIDPANPMGLKSFIEFVQQDKRCIIFPEGRLTTTGALMKIYEGPGLVADKSGAKLLPIHIEGAQCSPFSRLRGKLRLQLLPKIIITIFPAQTLNIPAEIKGKNRRQKISNALYDIMTTITFESNDLQKTLFQSLISASATHGARHVIMEDINRTPISYQQFITRCFILGNAISKVTYRQENVGVLLPNTIANAVTFFALQAYGRVPAMLNYTTGINNVMTACKTAKITTVYTSNQFIKLAKLTEMVNLLKQANINVVYLEDLYQNFRFTDKLKGIISGFFPRLSYDLINSDINKDANNAAVILFTSGSEGAPKAVVLTHKNIQANRYQLSSCIDFTRRDKVFNALPMFHSFGLTAGMILPILSGVNVFLYPSPLHYRIVPELNYDVNATILFGTDTFLSSYAKHAHRYDFYSLRYVFAGAEKLRDETRSLWSQKFGVRVFEGYGATETSPVLAINTPMQNQVGTVGRFLPGVKYEIKSVPGIEDGGLLVVSGPNIMKGYILSNQPGTLVSYEEKKYETGDIVSIDENGFITIKGRVKRFAKIAGEMVSLTMVEQEMNKLWPTFQHAVINIPDHKKGEQLVLVTNCPHANREEIVAYAKSNHMGDIAIPKKILIQQKMPLLGTGKIDYTSLKEAIISIAS